MLGLESLVVAGDDLAEEAVVAASPTVRSGASAKLVTERKSRLGSSHNQDDLGLVWGFILNMHGHGLYTIVRIIFCWS